MSFQKDKTTRFGVDASYHTITDVRMSFLNLPALPKSTITLSSYKNRAAYEDKAMPLSQKTYEVDFMTAISVVRSTSKTCERAAYDLIKSLDVFYSDALEVE